MNPPHAWMQACRRSMAVLAGLLLSACAAPNEPASQLAKEEVYALTADMQLIKFNAGQPQRLLERKPLQGLPASDRLVGMDFRVARGVLYALAGSGQLYTVDTAAATLTPLGHTPLALPLSGSAFGVDFNPVADRIRVVSDAGQNLRLHPDTGAVVDFDANLPGVQADPSLVYAQGDRLHGKTPGVVAAAYTYNKKDGKLTTNYAIDRVHGVLVRQGSAEGESPVVSPNLGLLTTVGELGLGPLSDASFDISDLSNRALAVLRTASDPRSRLYGIDLRTGRASLLGTVGEGAPLIGMAIEP